MRNFLLAALLLPTLGLWAQKDQQITSKHGYRIVFHKDMGQPKATFMDEIVVNVGVFIGDSLLQTSTKFAPDGFKAPLPNEDEFNNSPSAPVLVDAGMLMGAGDSLTAYMAIDSFIRTTLPPALRSFNEVRYEIKMLKVINAEEQRKAREAQMARFEGIKKEATTIMAAYRSGGLKVKTLPSGLKYYATNEGDGLPVLQGQNIAVHYYGCLNDGTEFDNSFQRGEPIMFSAGEGQMIPGFDEGVMNLRHGAKAYLFIPSKLGYGEQASGPIPANSDLVFYIEIQ